jgi:myo-inositol-1(or 4)-monophosphatase
MMPRRELNARSRESFMHPMINIALRAARKAGEVIMRNHQQLNAIKTSQKSMNDYVTNVDQSAEKEILYHLHKAYPEHSILTEESGLVAPLKGDSDEFQWVVDPLDGTLNFIHDIPHYAVSIACIHNGKIQHAVILDPIRNEEFIASRGQGAQLNGKRIRVSNTTSLTNSMFLTGIPSLTRQQPYQAQYHKTLGLLQENHQATFRNSGSAALNLAYIAAGRADAYWEPSLKPWDMAAGILLVQEAGGLICDFNGDNKFYQSGNIIASNKKCLKPLLQLIKD